jgi:hypothetical protein
MTRLAMPRLYISLFCLFAAFYSSARADSAYPPWWQIPAESSLELDYALGTPESDFSPLALGQLKYFAAKGRVELDRTFGPFGGSGEAIQNFVDGLSVDPIADLAPANIGQLKFVSSLFFNRFTELGYGPGATTWPDRLVFDSATNLPWASTTPIASDLAIANIGQAKFLFQWEVFDWAIQNYWDNVYFGDLGDDLDGDSVSNRDELLQGTDPFTALDADMNGLADDWELFFAVSNATADLETPPDGLLNVTESKIGTHPTRPFNSSGQMTIFLPR